MATATSRSLLAAVMAGAAVALSACGAGSAAPGQTAGAGTTAQRSGPATSPARVAKDSPSAGFSWLQSRPIPRGWSREKLPDGAVLAYPPGWTPIEGDAGTASAALFGPGHRLTGYLNLTPRQGDETLGNWVRSRLEHNAEDGQHDVRLQAGSGTLRYGSGRAACVRDGYTTSTRGRYVEIACLLSSSRGGGVVVAASPPGAWSREAALLERAISSVKL